MLLFCMLFQAMPSLLLGEMPERPTLRDLCREVPVIVKARAVKWIDMNMSPNNGYRVISFNVTKVYKGTPRMDPLLTERTGFSLFRKKYKDTPGNYVHIVVATRTGVTEILKPKYQIGSDYVLFLDDSVIPGLYSRDKIDAIWPETAWTEEADSKIEQLLSAASIKDDLRIPPNAIPSNAIEKLITLSPKEAEDYSKKTTYWIGDQQVGERGWWSNGKLAYEGTMKEGQRHGMWRGWYKEGQIWQERHYRFGKMHGYYTEWGVQGDLKLTFWIDGKPVEVEDYIIQARIDDTLPPNTNNLPGNPESKITTPRP